MSNDDLKKNTQPDIPSLEVKCSDKNQSATFVVNGKSFINGEAQFIKIDDVKEEYVEHTTINGGNINLEKKNSDEYGFNLKGSIYQEGVIKQNYKTMKDVGCQTNSKTELKSCENINVNTFGPSCFISFITIERDT